jgi:hypothetical protein
MTSAKFIIAAVATTLVASTAFAQANPAPKAIEDTEQAVKLRELEERVNELKERIFRSKARLLLLRETVLSGAISGARAVIVHRNEMGPSFTLEQISYSLDGAPLINRTETDGSLDEQQEIELFNGSIVPGNHSLGVLLRYRGNGYGVFSYLKGYEFKVRGSFNFTAEEGRVITVKAVGFEKGGFTTDIKERPSIRYDTEVKQDAAPAAAPAAG